MCDAIARNGGGDMPYEIWRDKAASAATRNLCHVRYLRQNARGKRLENTGCGMAKMKSRFVCSRRLKSKSKLRCCARALNIRLAPKRAHQARDTCRRCVFWACRRRPERSWRAQRASAEITRARLRRPACLSKRAHRPLKRSRAAWPARRAPEMSRHTTEEASLSCAVAYAASDKRHNQAGGTRASGGELAEMAADARSRESTWQANNRPAASEAVRVWRRNRARIMRASRDLPSRRAIVMSSSAARVQPTLARGPALSGAAYLPHLASLPDNPTWRFSAACGVSYSCIDFAMKSTAKL